MKDLFVSALLDVYGEFLSEKQRALTEYYYNDDLSLSEIAENEGITRQGASDLIKRSVSQLKEYEEKCRYCERFLKLKELAEDFKKGDKSQINSIIEVINEL
ncbi:MAG: DNA-binding protein [Clostridia bacterium]|nr:DNA-binding protein [Clostridia bacterium]